MNFFMKLISTVLHPLLIATYLMTVLYFFAPELFGGLGVNRIPMLIAATAITTFIIPGLSMGMMRMTSKITSLELSSRDERFMPFLTITLFYGVTTYMFITQFRVGSLFAVMMILVTSLIFILSIITTKFKISIHAAANWAATGILTYLLWKGSPALFYPVIGAILCSGLVCTSRLYQGLHSPREIWIGSVFGFGFCLIGLFILRP